MFLSNLTIYQEKKYNYRKDMSLSMILSYSYFESYSAFHQPSSWWKKTSNIKNNKKAENKIYKLKILLLIPNNLPPKWQHEHWVA